MSDPLKSVNLGLSALQLLDVGLRIQALARKALAEGDRRATPEEIDAAVGGNDAAMDALRAAIHRAEG